MRNMTGTRGEALVGERGAAGQKDADWHVYLNKLFRYVPGADDFAVTRMDPPNPVIALVLQCARTLTLSDLWNLTSRHGPSL